MPPRDEVSREERGAYEAQDRDEALLRREARMRQRRKRGAVEARGADAPEREGISRDEALTRREEKGKRPEVSGGDAPGAPKCQM